MRVNPMRAFLYFVKVNVWPFMSTARGYVLRDCAPYLVISLFNPFMGNPTDLNFRTGVIV